MPRRTGMPQRVYVNAAMPPCLSETVDHRFSDVHETRQFQSRASLDVDYTDPIPPRQDRSKFQNKNYVFLFFSSLRSWRVSDINKDVFESVRDCFRVSIQ
jgi:hypothetical protein